MKVSSYVKLFGIVVAGLVPQAHANPITIWVQQFGFAGGRGKPISLAVRLFWRDVGLYSSGPLFITCAPDKTVHLEKHDLEEDFKNFNSETDPFEIPDKWLPLTDEGRAKWVDKDGKPLKLFVVLVHHKVKRDNNYAGSIAWGKEGSLVVLPMVCVSGEPKGRCFESKGSVRFLDNIDFLINTHDTTDTELLSIGMEEQIEQIKKVGLSIKSSVFPFSNPSPSSPKKICKKVLTSSYGTSHRFHRS